MSAFRPGDSCAVTLQPRASRITRAFARFGIAALAVTSLFAGTAPAHAESICAITTAPTWDPTTAVVNNPHSMYNTLHDIGAPTYYQPGYFGQGVDVALIDTGVAPVPGLNGSNVVHGADLSFESQNPDFAHVDTFGHGTHLAGIISGRDFTPSATRYEDPTKFQGVAPLARVVSIKVGDSMGAVDVAQIIAAIDWAVTHRRDNGMNIRVINLSLALLPTDYYTNDALSYAAMQAWKNGIVVVASSGNSGKQAYGANQTSPAFNSFLMSAGSYDPATNVASAFSTADGMRIPLLYAPGQSIGSLHVAGSYADTEIVNDCLQTASSGGSWKQPVWGPDGRFVNGSGTSQSAAILSGAAALVLSQHPNYTPEQVRILLGYGSSTPVCAGSTCLPALNLSAAYAYNQPTSSLSYNDIAGGSGLDAARGDSVLRTADGLALTGNVDWFGNPLDLGALQNREPKGDVWKSVKDSTGKVVGESWNGEVLTGGTMGSDPLLGNNVWTGHAWSGTDWSGNRWSDHAWSGNRWSGNRWSGGDWAAGSWTGNRWSGNSWRDFSWS
jgi:serine protease AprX